MRAVAEIRETQWTGPGAVLLASWVTTAMIRRQVQRDYPRDAQPARGGDRSHRTGAPFEPIRSVYLFYSGNIAVAHLVARRFEQAIDWADRALHDQPRFVSAMRFKVVANAHLGRLDAARAELCRALAIDPKLTIAGFREYAHYAAPEVLELYVAGLRLAGLPEG